MCFEPSDSLWKEKKHCPDRSTTTCACHENKVLPSEPDHLKLFIRNVGGIIKVKAVFMFSNAFVLWLKNRATFMQRACLGVHPSKRCEAKPLIDK